MALPLLVLVGMVALASAASALPGRPRYLDCVSSTECGPWECCLLGPGRFSLPKCTPMADVGDPCVPGDPRDELLEERAEARQAGPLNTTVSYPDGQRVNLLVFRGQCPCFGDLRCDPEAAVCTASAERSLDNTL